MIKYHVWLEHYARHTVSNVTVIIILTVESGTCEALGNML